MSFLTIILFFIYTYGLGFSIAKLAGESENFLERNLMRIGIGLALMIVLGLLLNLIKVPLDWRILLALSIIIPLFYSLRNIRNALQLSYDTSKDYLSYYKEAFLFFILDHFSYSFKEQKTLASKIYCIDNGLRNAVSFAFSKDEGKLVENIVFLELRLFFLIHLLFLFFVLAFYSAIFFIINHNYYFPMVLSYF